MPHFSKLLPKSTVAAKIFSNCCKLRPKTGQLLRVVANLYLLCVAGYLNTTKMGSVVEGGGGGVFKKKRWVGDAHGWLNPDILLSYLIYSISLHSSCTCT